MKRKLAEETRPEGARRQDGERASDSRRTTASWTGEGNGKRTTARGAVRNAERRRKGKSYQQPVTSGAKKRERKVSKGKGKETIPGSWKNPLSPRTHACACEVGAGGRGRQRRISRYRLAGAAAEELIGILGAKATEDNRRLWAYYCYHHDIEIIFEKAYQYASEHRQGEVGNPVTAFQRWLSRTFGCDR